MKSKSKLLLFSFGPLVVIVLLSLFALKYSLSKISDIREQVAANKRTKNILEEKLSLLSEVDADISTSSDISLSALPENSPTAVVISQLKRQAASVGVGLTNIKSGGGIKDKSGLSRVDVSFEALAPREQLLVFLKSIETFAPISLVTKFKLNEIGGISRGTFTVSSYWAPLPQKLPPIDSPINDLTSAEKELLSKISTLTQPIFLEVPASEEIREDAFGI